jgi:hypothetical protein
MLLSAVACPAMIRAQAISRLLPAAAAPGKTTEVILHGTKLDEPLRVWTNLPAQVQVVQENVEQKGRTQIKLQVTVDAAAPAQIGGLFVATAEGVSDPLFFAIDDLPSVADNGKNQALASAQEIAPLAAIDGQCDGTQGDHYKFNLAAGQRVAVEVLATRLASDLDPIVQLLDANGKEILAADDDAATGSDGRLAFTAPAAATYHLKIRDVRYRGGANFFYRLRVGDFPLVSTAHPLGIVAGQSGSVEAVGPDVANVAPYAVLAAPGAQHRQAIGLKLNAGQSSALATLVSSTHPQVVEVEPNDAPEAATKIALPCGINGRFHTAKDRDQFSFDAKANTSYVFRPITRSIGSPCYLQLSLFKPDGSLLAEAAVTEADEQPLVATFPADGAYRLVVEDLLRRGGPEFGWHVEAVPFSGFGLQLKPDKATPSKFALAKNGAISLEVQAVRAGYDGPITLTVEPADRGFVLLNNVIGEKQPATRMIIVAPPGANVGDAVAMRIVGAAQRDGQTFTMPVSTAALVRAKAPQLAYPPAWLDGLLPVAIVVDLPDLFTITPSAPLVTYPRSAPQIGFTLVMDRKQGEFKDPLTVMTENLPAGVSAAIAREGNGPQEKYNVVFKAPKEVAEAKQDVRFQCYGEMGGRGRLLTVNVPIAVVTPIATTITPEAPISPGQKQKVKISVARLNPEDKQPVTIKWKKLPPGVTAPGDAAIAADQTEVIVELAAAADAPVAPFEGVLVEAITKFQGVDVALDSAPAKWEVK